MDGLPGAERFQECHHLALVVDRAARDNSLAVGTVHDRGLKGRAVPKFKRFGGLNVVMAVIEEVGRARSFPFMMGKKNGMAGRFVQRRLKSERPQLILEIFARAPHLVLVSGIGRYRRDTQKREIARHSVPKSLSAYSSTGSSLAIAFSLSLNSSNFAKSGEKCGFRNWGRQNSS